MLRLFVPREFDMKKKLWRIIIAETSQFFFPYGYIIVHLYRTAYVFHWTLALNHDEENHLQWLSSLLKMLAFMFLAMILVWSSRHARVSWCGSKATIHYFTGTEQEKTNSGLIVVCSGNALWRNQNEILSFTKLYDILDHFKYGRFYSSVYFVLAIILQFFPFQNDARIPRSSIWRLDACLSLGR